MSRSITQGFSRPRGGPEYRVAMRKNRRFTLAARTLRSRADVVRGLENFPSALLRLVLFTGEKRGTLIFDITHI